MSYSVKNSAQTVTYTVADGAANTNAISLTFLGKNETNYGTYLNQNFLWLLENFSNTSSNPPNYPVQGQLWWDSTHKFLNVYDGVNWNTVYGNIANLNVNNSASFSTITAATIGNSGTIYTGLSANLVGGVTSVGQNFNANPVSTDAGRIFGVYNLNYMPGASYSPSDNRIFDFGVTTGNIAYVRTNGSNGVQWYAAGNGTSFNNAVLPISNASINLGSTTNYWNNIYGANVYGVNVNAANGTFLTSLGVGTNSPLYTLDVKSPSGEYRTAIFETASTLGPSVQIKGSKIYELRSTDTGASEGAGLFFIYDKDNNVSRFTVNSNGYIGIGGVTSPTAPLDVNGNITARAANIYAANQIANTAIYSASYYWANGTPFVSSNYGNTQVAGYLGVVATSIVPSVSNTYTLGSSTNWWTTAYTQSVQAKYADLAEKYLPDADYEVGTVMMVGGVNEVTQHDGSNVRAIGVISEYPAYTMNSDQEGGVYIALKGRVPVRAIGPIKKGQALIGTAHGLAIAQTDDSQWMFAISLQDLNDSVGIVEAVIL